MNFFSLPEITNSKVLVWCDFDVTLDQQGNITSDYRIKRCLPTIRTLLKNNNQLALFSKLGRPVNKEPSLSTKNLIPKLKYLLNENIEFENVLENLANSIQKNKVILFENPRFFQWEELEYLKLNPIEAKKIKSSLEPFDYFVDESFAMSHRREVLTFLFPKVIGKIAAGENYLNEVEHLSTIRIGRFERPAYFVLGGAKAETKIPLMQGIIKNFDMFLVGGLMPKEILNSPELSASLQNRAYISDLAPSGMDITKESTDKIISRISSAATIVWNGPLGKFESELYQKSTVALVNAIEKNQNAVKIVGGGDTISAIEKFGDFSKYNFISTGGGAMFSFLANNKTNLESLGMNF